MSILGRIHRSIQRRGVCQTAFMAVHHIIRHYIIAGRWLWDLPFDLRYGTDTRAWLEANKLGAVGDNLQHAVMYEPTHATTFVRLMKDLELPRSFGFVDLGCGKGRVLLLAAKSGFRVIRGVEFSAVLCETARRNVERYARFIPAASDISIQMNDVTQYELQADEHIYFLFNPFDAVVISKMLTKFQHSLKTHPRPFYVIYNNPVHKGILDASGLFNSDRAYKYTNSLIVVYSNIGTSTG